MAVWKNNTSGSGTGFGSGYTFGLKIRPKKDIVVSAIQVYLSASNVGVKASIWRVSDSVRMVQSSRDVDPGWQSFTVTPTTLLANVTYIISVYASGSLSLYTNIGDGTWVTNSTGDDGTNIDWEKNRYYTTFDGYPSSVTSGNVLVMGLTYTLANAAPNAPTGLSPSGTQIRHTQLQNFTFSATDPDGNTLTGAKIQYRQQGAGTWVGMNEAVVNVASGGTVTYPVPSYTFNPALTYEWQAQVKDSNGAWSAWSATATFTTKPVPITSPTSPINGAKKNARLGFPLDWGVSGAPQTAYEARMRKPGLTAPTFTRASSATLSDLREMGNNVPRIEQGRLLLETGTTNLIPYGTNTIASLADFSSYASPTSPTKALDTGVHGASSGCIITTSTGAVGTWLPQVAVTAGTAYTFSCYTREAPIANRNARVYVSWRNSVGGVISTSYGSVTPASSNWRRLSVNVVAPTGAVNAFLFIELLGTLAVGDKQWFDCAQFEQKAYPTTWHPSIRATETFDIPASTLSFSEGTIELEFTPTSNYIAGSSWTPIIGHGTAEDKDEISLLRAGSTSKVAFAISNNAGLPQGGDWLNCQSTTVLQANVTYRLAVKWSISQGIYALYVNGVKESERPLTAEFLPSVRGIFALGYHPYTSRHTNSMFGALRVSSRARTDQEIADAVTAGVYPWDKDTTYALAFSDDIQPGASYGKVTSATALHAVPANQLSDIGDPTYEWAVRAYNDTDDVGAWSSFASFQAWQPYAATGEIVSPIFDAGVRLNGGAISWAATLPTDSALAVYYRTSADNVTWGEWTAVINGGTLPNHRYVQYKAVLTASSDFAETPRLDAVLLSFPEQYYASGEWVSPQFDLRSILPGTTKVEFPTVTTPAGTTMAVEMRSSHDKVNWTAWTPVVHNDPFPSTGLWVQARILLTTSGEQATRPSVDKLVLTANQAGKRGVWESEVLDVSDAKDKASGRVVNDVVYNDGTLNTESRSSANNGVSWTQWTPALADGTLQHAANNHVQVRHILTAGTTVGKTTLALDGEAQASLILSGMTPDSEYDFATFRDTVIIVNGKDANRKWDGVAAPATLGGNCPIFTLIETHHNRLWGVEAENPSRVRFSGILEIEFWDTLDFIDFNPEDGDRVTSIYSYGQYLMISKARSMAFLSGDQKANYSVVWLEDPYGAQGRNALCAAGKYLAYVAQDGIRFTDLTTSVLATERIAPDWAKLNNRRLNQAALVYWRNLLLCALPKGSSLRNDTVLVYDFLRNAWSIYPNMTISMFVVFNQYGRDYLFAADSTTGQVYEMFEQRVELDNLPVGYEWQSKDFDFGHPERYKLFRGVFLDIEGVAEDSELNVTFIVDGEEKGTYTTTIPAGAGLMHNRWILPPLYDAVLGSRLALRLQGAVGVQGIALEYIVRGINVAGVEV